jgi:hypothetical protein
MKPQKLLTLTSVVAPLLLSGCSQISTSYALSKDESQVAIALNKDRNDTILAVNNGERIVPCVDISIQEQEQKQEQKQEQEQEQLQHEPGNDRLCGKINPDDVIFEKTYRVVVRKGSTCISIWVSNKRYDFCDPPYDLNF